MLVFLPRFGCVWEFGGVFLDCGVGEGSVRALTKVIGARTRPLGVSAGEGVRFAALGRLILRGVGVLGPLAGVEPETVRFLPVVGVENGSVAGFCEANVRPSSSAAVKRYLAFLLRTAADISFSCDAARFSISSAFQRRHFSSTSPAAFLAAFSLKFFLRVRYQSLYPSWSGATLVSMSEAVAAMRWKSVGYLGPMGLGSTTSALILPVIDSRSRSQVLR